MKRSISLRMISIMLALILTVSLIPMTAANAVTNLSFDYGDVSIGNFTGDAHSGMTGADSFRVSATGEMETDIGFHTRSGSVTLTVAADDYDRILVFDYYSLLSAPVDEAGSITFTEKTNGSNSVVKDITGCYQYSHFIAAGDSFELKIMVTTVDGANTTAIDVENIELVESVYDAEFFIDFDYEYGTVLSEEFEYEEDVQTPESEGAPFDDIITGVYTVAMLAQPEDGYEFVAYVNADTGVVLSNNPRFDYKPVYNGEVITAVFAPESEGDTADYQIGSYYCSSFEDAIEYARYASDRVIAVNQPSVTLSGGRYALPRGVTLLVPYNDDHTMFTSVPHNSVGVPATRSTDYLYCCLNLTDGAKIIVENGAAISVSSVHPATTNSTLKVNGVVVPNNGAVSGYYSQIQMDEGTGITLLNGSTLYAWGFITGDGMIEAMNGAVVYELIQINDYRGGGATSMMSSVDKNQFFFNQYYVQNIEAALKINYGAVEYVAMDLYVSSVTMMVQRPFIGNSEEGAFRLDTSGSYLIKKYNPELDVMNYDFYGTASLHSIEFSAAGYDLSTEHLYLPINDIVLNVLPGSVMNMEKKVIFMPGSGATVSEGAEINISGSGSVVFADTQDEAIQHYSVNNSTPCRPATFSPTRPADVTRTWADTEDAYLENGGSVNVTDSATLASTSGGANIYGEGTFTIESTAEPPELTVAVGSSAENSNLQPTATASLTNEDDTEVNMDVRWSTPASFRKINGVWGDYRMVTLYDRDQTTVLKTSENTAVELWTYDQFTDAVGGFLENAPVPADYDDEYYNYTFTGEWELVEDATTQTHAKFCPIFEQDGKEFPFYWYTEDGSSYEISYEKYNTKPTHYPNYEKEATAEYTYSLKWKVYEGSTSYTSANLPTVTGPASYQATYVETKRRYVVNWRDYIGGSLANSTYTYGTRPSRAQPPTTKPRPTGGTFYGWMDVETKVIYPGSTSSSNSTIPTVKGPAAYMATYSLTVTWKDSDDTTLGTTTVYTNTVPTPDAAYAALDPKDGNKFVGWTRDGGVTVYDAASIPALTGEITAAVVYTAVYENNVEGKTLTLDGLIGENIYFNASADVESVSMSYLVTDTGVVKPASPVEYDSTNHRMSVSLAPAELTFDINAQYTYSDGGTEKTRMFVTHGYDYAASLFSGDAVAAEIDNDSYYLLGTFSGRNCWSENINKRYKFTANPYNPSEYMLEHVYLARGDEFKAYLPSGNSYYPDGGNYYVNMDDGYYTIYFSPTYKGDWSGHFYLSGEMSDREDVNYAKNVVSALMNYASKAQLYFGRNVGDLANDHLNGNVYTYIDDETDALIAAYDAANPNTMPALKTGETAEALASGCGLQYYGSMFVLNAGVTMRHYFRVVNHDLVPDQVTFIHNGIEYTADVVADSAAFVHYDYVKDGSGIPGAELGDVVAIRFNTGSGTISGNYNLFNYAKLAIADAAENASDAKKTMLADLLRSMYWYYVEAKTYFNL